MECYGETLGAENDGLAGLFERSRDREIVTRSALPGFEHLCVVESGAADGCATAPAKIVARAAEHGGNSGVPSGGKRARESAGAKLPAGDQPAISGGRADFGVLKWSNQFCEPMAGQGDAGGGGTQRLK